MNAEVNSDPRAAKRSYSVRTSEFVASRRGKMFGVAEVIAVAGSCLVLALVLLSYLYFLVPARSRLASLNVELKQVQTNLETLSGVVHKEEDTRQTVDKIAASLNKFETEHLLRPDEGRMDLYQELNQLIIKNNLKNTSGPAYTTLDPVGTKQAGKSVTTKWQSFYPGIGVMVTVEGQYQDVRRFIRDVERSKQFVVINEVELQRATQSNTPVSVDENGAPVAGASGSGTRGSLVSLQLNMATYFQRGAIVGEQPAQ
ncbi:MAG TPA: GspMb/PilO family protein [Pyrinomonadaceae bacterium]